MDKPQKSRRKTIKAVDKEGLEEEIEKKRAGERELNDKKQKDAKMKADKEDAENEEMNRQKSEQDKANRNDAEQREIQQEYIEEKARLDLMREQKMKENKQVKQEAARQDEIKRIDLERKKLLAEEELKQAELDKKKRETAETNQLEEEMKEGKNSGIIKTQNENMNSEQKITHQNNADIPQSNVEKQGESTEHTTENEEESKKAEKQNTNAPQNQSKKIITDQAASEDKSGGQAVDQSSQSIQKSQESKQGLSEEGNNDDTRQEKKHDSGNGTANDQKTEDTENPVENENLLRAQEEFKENERRRFKPPITNPDQESSKEIPNDEANFLTKSENENAKKLLADNQDKSKKGDEPSNNMNKRVNIDEDNNEKKNIECEDENKAPNNRLVDITNRNENERNQADKGKVVTIDKPSNFDQKADDNTNEKNKVGAENQDKKSQDKNDIALQKQEKEHKQDIANEKQLAEASTNKEAYLAAGLAPPSQSGDKILKPIYDEDVERDIKRKKENLHIDTERVDSNSEIGKARSENRVAYEGKVYKRRFFFSCCWHERHFILTKDGALRYYRNKNKKGKGDINIATVRDLHRLDELDKKHPYKIMLRYFDREDLMGFDEEPERNRWAAKLAEVRRNLL